MNFAGTISRFATGTYTVTRRGPTRVGGDGIADPGTPSTFPIVASVQAMSGLDLERMPESMRTTELRKLYTETPLQCFGAPDVVSIDGADWEVQTVTDDSVLGNYFKAIVQKVAD